MSKIKDILLKDENHSEKSRIMSSTVSISEANAKAIKNIYFNNLIDEENVNYLAEALGIDKDRLNTTTKLKNRLQSVEIHNKFSNEEIASIFVNMPAMSNIINELLFKGIIKEQYKLSPNGKKEKDKGISKYKFEYCFYGYDDDKCILYNANVIEVPLIYVIGGTSFSMFTNARDSDYKKLDGVTTPDIKNADNAKNIRYVKKWMNRVAAQGNKIELSNNDDYEYLVNVDHESLANTIANDLAYYFYYIDADRKSEVCYLEMNNSYEDKQNIFGRLLEHLFLSSQIINKDGREYQKELSARLFETVHDPYSDYYQEDDRNEFMENKIFNLISANKVFSTDNLYSTRDTFGSKINEIQKDIRSVESIHKSGEDDLLSLDRLSDEVASRLLEISSNCMNVEKQFLQMKINTFRQLQDKFGAVENMFKELKE